jgi:shikimate kinase
MIGFMGSGKTTLGKRLAAKLSYQFIDLDKLIEAETRSSITEYFAKFGEEPFRELESRILKETDYPEDSVIATGGGAPCFFDNIQWMNKNGTTVYLSLSPKSLASRLESATEQRPVLRNLKGEALENFIAEKLDSRKSFYEQAKLRIKGADQTPERLVALLKAENHLK